MKTNLYLIVFSADHPCNDESIMVHFWDNLQRRLQEETQSDTIIESVSWHQDPLVKILIQRMVAKCDGGIDFLNNFHVEIGYFQIQIESESNYLYRKITWLEDVIKTMHEEMDFVGSEFFYLVKNSNGKVVFHSFTKIHTPNLDSDSDDGMACSEMDSYAGLFDDYFYSGSIADSFAPDAARLLLLGGLR